MESNAIKKMTPFEKQAYAKALLADVADEFEGVVTPWVRSEHFAGLWDFAEVSVSGCSIPVGVSGGGVVNINGKPFDQDGQPNDNPVSIRHSIRRALQELSPAPAVRRTAQSCK